jgi:hypothetical protein
MAVGDNKSRLPPSRFPSGEIFLSAMLLAASKFVLLGSSSFAVFLTES